ncbi:VOC family protein [Streptomyces sp. NPDC001941]|uniref:VOC family protein n=1 Tax=Streptomyces sp. NPDC001941 TaxID=3154659 RepID=UPI00332DD0CD
MDEQGQSGKVGTPEVLAAIAGDLGDWRKLGQGLWARFRADGLAAGAAFAAAVAEAGGEGAEFRLGAGVVDVTLCSREADGGRWITARELELARTVSALAAGRGLVAEPSAVAQLELALDTVDFKAVAPFWSALLTGSPDNVVFDSVFDPTNRVPSVWFQPTDPHRAPRQRWHFDLWLAPEAADARIAAALAAGGTLVDDSGAPSFTVLADPEGNKVCVCTALERE